MVVLPTAVRIGHYLTDDTRNDEVTRQFLESGIGKDAADAETVPYTVEQIRALFLGRLGKGALTSSYCKDAPFKLA